MFLVSVMLWCHCLPGSTKPACLLSKHHFHLFLPFLHLVRGIYISVQGLQVVRGSDIEGLPFLGLVGCTE